MKIVIFCGGAGTRMKEETEYRPKPLVSVGGKPILWHIMKLYSHFNYRDFILTLGYKGDMIKDYFLNQKIYNNDFTLNTFSRKQKFHKPIQDNFNITFLETGLETETGGRLLQAKDYIGRNEFMVTYGDGVGNIDIKELLNFHRKQKTIGTITGTHPYSKYGLIKINRKTNLIRNFKQKPLITDYVNGGFMVFKKQAFSYFDNGPIEDGLERMVKDGQLSVFRHDDFWKAMDTYREVRELNKIWEKRKPWAVWEENK
ncbi:glucose-1-phosphate cytidylyltransferase [Patescibacteria group bacterium]|nr:glucose-1-phosphate cytidylyltransferase [Patescibacteria group bacterium]